MEPDTHEVQKKSTMPNDFNQLMNALLSEIKEILPDDKQFVRFTPLQHSFVVYAIQSIRASKLLSSDDYFIKAASMHGFKLNDRKMSFKKYKGHAEAESLLSSRNTTDFMKILLSVDNTLGLVANIKLIDANSVSVPIVDTADDNPLPIHRYEAAENQEQQMRLYRCLQAMYVSEKSLMTARKSDKNMKKFYMSFHQLKVDLQKLSLLDLFKEQIWQLVLHLQKNPQLALKQYAYDKLV